MDYYKIFIFLNLQSMVFYKNRRAMNFYIKYIFFESTSYEFL